MLTGTGLAGMSMTRERIENDFYATPYASVHAILRKETLKGSILEPACGSGNISQILKMYYPNQLIVSTDLVDRGYGIPNVDFLTHDFGKKFDNVITNPPFKYAQQFIEKGLEWSNDKVLMFAKVQLLEGQARRKMWDAVPLKYVYVFSERQNPLPNNTLFNEKGKKWNSTMCFSWFVFQHGFHGEPSIKWL